jgi:hypothetical protein
MKKNILYPVFLLLLPVIAIPQDWGGMKPKGFWDHWSVNATGGLTSYFGDMSYHDSYIPGKLTYESRPAFAIKITKHFNRLFGVSGQLIYGNIEGGNNKNLSFHTRLAEYNLQASVDIVKLFTANRAPKFGFEGYAGLGQYLFKVTQYMISEGEENVTIHETGVPEFVYFAGAGAHYHLGQNFAVTASLSLHHAQNDKLDNVVKNNDYDYYSYLSAGITYYISSFKKAPLRNKARIAHSGIRVN